MNSADILHPDADPVLTVDGDDRFWLRLAIGLGITIALYLVIKSCLALRKRKRPFGPEMSATGSRRRDSVARKIGRWLLSPRY
jgi:hypothetical protein